jgi:long-chain acyl-CoA synthetase
MTNLAIANAETLPVVYPPGIRWDIDIPDDITPLKLVEAAIEKYADSNAIAFEGRDITYREFGNLVDRAASGLVARGVTPGMKVGLFMPNMPYYPIMLYAAMKAGATVVNFSVTDTEKEKLVKQIKNSDTEMMVTMDLKQFRMPVRELVEEGVLKQMVQCDLADMLPLTKGFLFRALQGRLGDPGEVNDKVTTFHALTNGESAPLPDAPKAQDVAVLQYTGGSSGVPKGAMLTHFNLAANVMQMLELFRMPSPDGEPMIKPGEERALAAIPASHIFALTSKMIADLANGNTLVMVADPRNTAGVLNTIEKQKATTYFAAPKLLQMINEHPKNVSEAVRQIMRAREEKPETVSKTAKKLFGAVAHYPWFRSFDISSLKTVIAGSEALQPGVRRDFEALTKPGIVSEGYGMTECSPLISVNLTGIYNQPGTVGQPAPRTEAKIVSMDEAHNTLNIGETGELWVRGPQVMLGYYKNPEETAATITEDGWLRTGDNGYLDESMRFHFGDRNKRMIKVNGHQVSPVEIENVVSNCSDVAECVVFGLPDERSGEAAKLQVRLKPDVDPAQMEAQLRTLMKSSHLKPISMPKYIEFVTEPLLKTSVNKVDWRQIQLNERAKMAPVRMDGPRP